MCSPIVEKIVGTECDDAEDCQKMLSNSICTQDKVCACKPGEEVYEYGGKSYCYVNLAGEQCHWSTTNECLSKLEKIDYITVWDTKDIA